MLIVLLSVFFFLPPLVLWNNRCVECIFFHFARFNALLMQVVSLYPPSYIHSCILVLFHYVLCLSPSAALVRRETHLIDCHVCDHTWSLVRKKRKTKKSSRSPSSSSSSCRSSSLDFLICASQLLVTFISCVLFFFFASFSPIHTCFFYNHTEHELWQREMFFFLFLSLEISSPPQFMIVISCAFSYDVLLSWGRRSETFFSLSLSLSLPLHAEFIFYVFQVLTWTYLCEVSLVPLFFSFSLSSQVECHVSCESDEGVTLRCITYSIVSCVTGRRWHSYSGDHDSRVYIQLCECVACTRLS